MDYTTLYISTDAGMVSEPVAVASLYEALQELSDPRRGQGKRYELALILCLLVLAKLAGQTSLSGATDWIRHRAASLAEQFGLRRKSTPCQMTYCNVLARVDAKQLDELLAGFFVRWEAEQRCGAEPSRLQTPQGQGDHAHLARDSQNTSCHQFAASSRASAQLL
jgi:hypothetical protein